MKQFQDRPLGRRNREKVTAKAPRSAQEYPQSGPRVPTERQETTQERQDAPKSGARATQERPRGAQEQSRAPQEAPKSGQEHPKRFRRSLPESPKASPRVVQEQNVDFSKIHCATHIPPAEFFGLGSWALGANLSTQGGLYVGHLGEDWASWGQLGSNFRQIGGNIDFPQGLPLSRAVNPSPTPLRDALNPSPGQLTPLQPSLLVHAIFTL